MFGKFMNNYFYGKSGKGDYTKEDLPSTRGQLFRETLRTRLSGLMRLNLIYMIAWLPAMAVILYHVFTLYAVFATLAEETATPEITAQLLDAAKSLMLTGLMWLIPSIAITGPFTAGLSYVTRNWARDEHAFAWGDFKEALVENWKPALLVSSITGLVPLVVYVCWMFYGELAKDNPLFLVPQVLTLTLGIIWMMSLLYAYPMLVTYRLRAREVLRNSLLLTIGRLPGTAAIKLLSSLPMLITLAVGFLTPYLHWAVIACFLYYILIGFALSRFVGASYVNAVFDKYINVKIEGAQINRGLYTEVNDDDDEDDDGENDDGDVTQSTHSDSPTA